MWGKGLFPSDPPLNPLGTATEKKYKSKPKWSLRASRQLHCDQRGLPYPVSSFLPVLSPSLTHCVAPGRKSASTGPESEQRRFLLWLWACFLFKAVAILHAPGGPILRVPACWGAVPEGCTAKEVPSETRSGRAGSGRAGSRYEGVCEEEKVVRFQMKLG